MFCFQEFSCSVEVFTQNREYNDPPAIWWAPGQLGDASGHWLPVFLPLSPSGLTASVQCSVTGRQGGCVASSWLSVLVWAVYKASQHSWSLVSVVPKALGEFSQLPYGSEEETCAY